MTKPSALPMPEPGKVEALAGYGLTINEIATVLEVEADLLKETCAQELKAGHLKANARVAENLFRKATGDGRESVTAAIFWLKTRARWKETSVHEHGGANGSPITFTTIYEAEAKAEEFIRKVEEVAARTNGGKS
jgi:hypothetical protein